MSTWSKNLCTLIPLPPDENDKCCPSGESPLISRCRTDKNTLRQGKKTPGYTFTFLSKRVFPQVLGIHLGKRSKNNPHIFWLHQRYRSKARDWRIPHSMSKAASLAHGRGRENEGRRLLLLLLLFVNEALSRMTRRPPKSEKGRISTTLPERTSCSQKRIHNEKKGTFSGHFRIFQESTEEQRLPFSLSFPNGNPSPRYFSQENWSKGGESKRML